MCDWVHKKIQGTCKVSRQFLWSISDQLAGEYLNPCLGP